MIILTMLGTGSYQETTYTWEGKTCETALFPVALATWFPEAQVKALVTEEAKARHADALLAAVPRTELIPIPSGKSEDELWKMFNCVAEMLPEGESVIFDITHGFRSLPVLSLLALSFLRVAKNINLQSVVYGAYDARDQETNISPVFDLTPFIKMLDGANATDRFNTSGDARGLQSLLSTDENSPLHSLAQSLTGLSDALFTGRVEREDGIWNQAVTFISTLDEALQEEHFANRTVPYRLLTDRLREAYSGLQLPANSSTEEELKVTWHLIRWYAERGHYVHASTLAREWCVSVRCWYKSLDPHLMKNRKEQENWLGAASALLQSKDITFPPEWDAIIKVSSNIQNLRNDLAHFKTERKVEKVRVAVKKLPDDLKEAVKPLGLEVGE
jgi:CRISPR-associated DxTHG motif protein